MSQKKKHRDFFMVVLEQDQASNRQSMPLSLEPELFFSYCFFLFHSFVCLFFEIWFCYIAKVGLELTM